MRHVSHIVSAAGLVAAWLVVHRKGYTVRGRIAALRSTDMRQAGRGNARPAAAAPHKHAKDMPRVV